MIHVTSERMSPIAAIEGNTINPTSNEVAAKRLLKKVALTTVASVAVMVGAITLANHMENDSTPVTTI